MHLLQGLDLPKRIMGWYGLAIERSLGLADAEMPAAVRQRLDEAPARTRVDLGGIFGVKPEPAEKAWFASHRLPRFFLQTLKGSVPALYHAAQNPLRLAHDDRDIAYLLDRTYFGRLIVEGADDQPLLDLAHHERLQTLPGFYTHGIKAFLRREDGRHVLDRIEIAGRSITPAHRSWSLAKIHLLAAMDNETLFTDHAVGHLNNNLIEAAALQTLSARNPFLLLLAPHFGFCIALDEVILELFYKHTSPGNPFAYPAQSIYDLMRKGFQDDHARGLSPVHADTSYNRALGEGYRVIFDHVDGVVERNVRVDSPEFAEIRAFSSAVREVIPYFPRGEDLDLAAVKAIAARFIHESSFVSSTDHIVTRSDLGYFRSIFRVRRPFVEDAPWQFSELFRPIDTYQRIVFRNVFSGDQCASRLIDVEYDPALGQVDALSEQAGASLEEFLPVAQRILWGAQQSDLIHVDLPAACAQLVAAHPNFFLTHLVVAFCERATGSATTADVALARARALMPPDHCLSYLFPTEDEWACVPPRGMLAEVVPGSIWRVSGYYTYPQCPFHQMGHGTIVRREDGSLMYINPVPLSPASAAGIRALGEVTHIVGPVKFHSRFIGEAQQHFPGAKTFGVPGHRVNPPSAHLRFDGVLDDEEPLFGDELRQVHIAGHQFEETAFFHTASRTVILHDLLGVNQPQVPGSTFWLRLCVFVWGIHDEVSLASYHPMMMTHAAALRRSLTRILAWDADRVLLCHAPNAAIPSGGRQVLRQALGWACEVGAPEHLVLAGRFFAHQPGFLRDLVRYQLDQRG